MKLFFAIGFLLSVQVCFGQSGKLYFIKDKDTLEIPKTGLKVFIETTSSLIPFNEQNKLIYPNEINYDSINSIIIIYQGDTISFYNFKEAIKYSRLPLPIIKMQSPNYKSIFADKRNMYLTVDNYPFENEDRDDIAKRNIKTSKVPYKKMAIIELYYQVRTIRIYGPKK